MAIFPLICILTPSGLNKIYFDIQDWIIQMFEMNKLMNDSLSYSHVLINAGLLGKLIEHKHMFTDSINIWRIS